MNAKNKFQKLIIFFTILSILAVSLSGCSSNEPDLLKEKVSSQINYLDSKILSILNELNDISTNRYKVVSEKTNSNIKAEENNNASPNAESEDNENNRTASENNTTDSILKMVPNNVLNRNNVINWTSIKMQVESIYSDWTTIILDLYKLNMNNDTILEFSTVLNTVIQYAKVEDKKNTIYSLTKLYSLIPKFGDHYLDKDYINILYTKTHVVMAYSMIEDLKVNEIKASLQTAEEYFLNIVNNMDSTKNQYMINKTFILLKEFQNSIDSNDIDLMLIKYKNLIQELNTL